MSKQTPADKPTGNLADNSNKGKGSRSATAASANQMMQAIGIMSVFVVIMTMVADSGPKAGRVVLLLMIGLLIVQGITHVNPFVRWVADHPLAPGDNTFKDA